MALAATGSVELAERVSAASARELKLAGINWAYSPVADINSEPRNPVIGVRSFGDDPRQVADYARAVSRGLTSSGVAPCPKHFPGHGDTHVDSHLALPRIHKDSEALSNIELVPFRALVEDDVPSIMTGHMALPSITGDDAPASLSATITTDLLRRALGYRGVIVTDCLEMEAVAARYGSERGAVLALQAGADVAMICHRVDRQLGAIAMAHLAVGDDRLSAEYLAESGDRIAALKDEFVGTWDDVLGELDSHTVDGLKSANASLSSSAYAASTALISAPHEILPLPKEDAVLVFTPRVESVNFAVDDAESVVLDNDGRVRNTAGPSYLAFVQSISSRATAARHFVYSPSTALPAHLESYRSIVFVTRNGHTSPWQMDYLRLVLEACSCARVVVVSSCAPYDLLGARDLFHLPLVATFEFTVQALEAATAVIFGERRAVGKVPVSLR